MTTSKTDREANAAALRAASVRLDALLDYDETEVDGILGEIEALRRRRHAW